MLVLLPAARSKFVWRHEARRGDHGNPPSASTAELLESLLPPWPTHVPTVLVRHSSTGTCTHARHMRQLTGGPRRVVTNEPIFPINHDMLNCPPSSITQASSCPITTIMPFPRSATPQRSSRYSTRPAAGRGGGAENLPPVDANARHDSAQQPRTRDPLCISLTLSTAYLSPRGPAPESGPATRPSGLGHWRTPPDVTHSP